MSSTTRIDPACGPDAEDIVGLGDRTTRGGHPGRLSTFMAWFNAPTSPTARRRLVIAATSAAALLVIAFAVHTAAAAGAPR